MDGEATVKGANMNGKYLLSRRRKLRGKGGKEYRGRLRVSNGLVRKKIARHFVIDRGREKKHRMGEVLQNLREERGQIKRSPR